LERWLKHSNTTYCELCQHAFRFTPGLNQRKKTICSKSKRDQKVT
jgi:hypothetical protein